MKYWLGIFLATGIGLGLQLLVNGHPNLFFGVYVLLPHLLVAVSMLLLGAAGMRLRGQAMEQFVALAIAVSYGLGCIAALVGLWNDGSGNIVLPPNQALLSFVTGGILPWKEGSVAMIRFFPLGCALVSFGWGWKRGLPKGRTVLWALGIYAALWAMWHGLTFLAMLVRPADLRLETAQDAFSAIVRAQTGGYWSNDAVNRFLAPVSDQGKSVSLLAEAAWLYLLSLVGMAVMWIKGMGPQNPLWKRLVGKDIGFVLAIALGTCALGQSLRVMVRVPFSVPMAIGIACISVLCIGIWMRMRMDIGNLREDEVEHPLYPLPSGAISVGDAEQIAAIALGYSLYGALLVGWSAWIGLLFGVAVTQVLDMVGIPVWQRGSIQRNLVVTAVCLGIAWAGLAVGLQDLMSATWLVRLALGLGLVGAGGIVLQTGQKGLAIASSLFILGSGIVSGQWLIGIGAAAALAVVWFMEFRETSQKRLIYPVFALFGWYIFALVFFPSAFART